MLSWVYKEIVSLNEKDLRKIQRNKIHTRRIPCSIYHIYTYKNIEKETVGMPGKVRMVQGEAFMLATGRVLIKVHLDIRWGQSFREGH